MARATEKQLDIMDALCDGFLLLNDTDGWWVVRTADIARDRRVDGRAAVGILARGIIEPKRFETWGCLYGLVEALP